MLLLQPLRSNAGMAAMWRELDAGCGFSHGHINIKHVLQHALNSLSSKDSVVLVGVRRRGVPVCVSVLFDRSLTVAMSSF